ncbi:MAG: biotin--[acetyl-CoA-carboxylase] ligase [Rhodobacteraceae bacterium]|nr:biotin--[acetyl-CoA-carboxylase] ligase [Paracoccaceae bacterium]
MLASVDSTNAEAVRIAKTVSGPTWILGLRQTQGRGRRGRAWMDPEGNFAGTLLLFPDGDPHSFALRSFVMSLALADSFETLFPHQVTCQLKWPNDALLNGAKVAGILLETVALSAGQMALAIGVGVNLKNAPEAGQMITARTQRDEYMGRFDSVDQSGHLILDTTDGRRAIAAADIYF